MARVGVAAALLLLAAGGGMQFYTSPGWAMAALLAVALLAVALLAGADLRAGLVLLGWYWPLVWLLLAGWWDNRNVAAVWFGVGALALLTESDRRAWLGVALNVAALLWLGSRGAMIGLWAGLLVLLWPWATTRRGLLAALLAAPLLLWWRPDTAIYRLWYWQQALAAWQSSPWWGVGFGGLQRACWIPEPGGGCQIHAHNLLLHAAAEFGVVGAVALLAVFLALLLAAQRPRWQWALLAALLAHSMVDVPLLWPGPLALFVALVIYPYQFLLDWKKLPGVASKKMVVSNHSGGEL